jgi:hypothetical protein
MYQGRALFRAGLKIDGYCLSAAYALRDRERQSRAACPSDYVKLVIGRLFSKQNPGFPRQSESSTQLNRGLLRSAMAAAA